MKKIAIIIMSVLLSVPVQANATTVNSNQCIGHRGAMELAPEGTIANFKVAKEAGYTKFECDVWHTQSGEFIICHDQTIKRLTGVNLPAYKLSTKNRKKYPIIYGKHVGRYPTQYFPTIQEVLHFAEENNMTPFFHLKRNSHSTFSKKALRKLNRIIKHYHRSNPVLFSSNENIVRNMSKYHWNKGYLTGMRSRKQLRSAFSFAKKHSCKYVIHPFFRNKRPRKSDIKLAHKKGLKVMCYRIATERRAKQALRLGEDFIITNRIVFGK